MYGVHSVAPGPIPEEFFEDTQKREQDSLAGTKHTQMSLVLYRADENGIQSSYSVENNFHRVARGLIPSLFSNNHLPCENSPDCWENNSSSHDDNIAINHPLDMSTPMPGVATCVSSQKFVCTFIL